MDSNHTATRVDGGWKIFDPSGEQVEFESKYHRVVFGRMGYLEFKVPVSIPGGPEEFPKKKRAKK